MAGWGQIPARRLRRRPGERIRGVLVSGTGAQNGDRYIGVDPGLQRTGYAVVERSASGPVLLEGGVVRSCRSDSLAERVHEMAVGIRELLEEYRPDTLAIEQVFSLVRNPKSALLVAHVRGAILTTAIEAGVAVVHYTPTQVKRILTGSGRATKEQIQYAIRSELGLSEVPEPHDVADACAVVLCHYHTLPAQRLL